MEALLWWSLHPKGRWSRMNKGSFYFLLEKYFIDFPDPSLEKNKEVFDGVYRDRPCFYAYQDDKTGLYWMIPISSKLDKYHMEYNKKINKYGICETIVFGIVLGQERAFLIQNMCPATLEYIGDEYAYSFLSRIPVHIEPFLKEELEEKAKNVLGMVRRGRKLIFPKVLKIEKELLSKSGRK